MCERVCERERERDCVRVRVSVYYQALDTTRQVNFLRVYLHLRIPGHIVPRVRRVCGSAGQSARWLIPAGERATL